MASQGGRFSARRYYGKKKCAMICKNRARWYYTCSPNFFELSYGIICTSCKKKCEACTLANKPIRSALD